MANVGKISEIDWTRRYALAAIAIITVFMILLNTTGAWIASHNAYYTGVIAGVEMLEIVCLVLVLTAPTLARRIVGGLIMSAVIYVCVENGKMSVQESFKDVFKDEKGQTLSAKSLRDKATHASTAATTLAVAAPQDAKDIKTEIAELKVFQKQMAAMSPEGIKAAQSEMIPRCGYTGRVDGIRSVLTEAAMRQCGEQITNRLAVLATMSEAGGNQSETKSNEAVDLIAKADEIDGRTVWMNILLFAIAGVQAAGVWAFVVWDEKKPSIKVDPKVFADLQEQADELARRKANIDSGVEKRETAKEKRKREADEKAAAIVANKLAIEDFRSEQAKREAVQKEAEAPPATGDEVATPSDLEAATDAAPPEIVAEIDEPAAPSSANDEDETDRSEAA